MKLINWFKAYFRLDLKQVCEMSKGKGYFNDYHDYLDAGIDTIPMHGVLYTCERCGKNFYI